MTVAITRRELDAGGLRREAGRCRDARAARRMLALALVLEGASREEAARGGGRGRAALRGRHGPADLARLGASVQRGGARRPARPAPPGAEAAADARAGGRAGGRRGAGAGPGPGRRGALAPGRPEGADRGPLRRRAARALGRQGAASARLRPPVGAPETPEVGRGGAGGVQKGFADLVAAALPERARGRPIEVWLQML